MQTIKELIAHYTEGEKIPTLDDLFDRLSHHGTPEEKELIADGYISDFGQCHYDYMCGKFNNLEWIWEMMDWIEKVKILNPGFDQYYFFKGHVYEMLSSVSEEQESKVKFNNLCIEHLRKQQEVNAEDITLLIDIAQNLFQHCRLIGDYQTQILDEIKTLFLKALHLERKEEHQSGFFGFNGSAISGFLNISYDFLGLSFDTSAQVHQEFISAFKKTIKPYTKKDPCIYYHWAETLVRITDRVDYPDIETCRISQEVVNDIWKEVKEVLVPATDLQSTDEHFLTSIGHLFATIAKKEASLLYYEIAYNYYSKALKINGETWSNPYYASNALRMMAFIHLENKERKESIKLFEQGIHIFKEAQKKVHDFQLSIYHAEYLYDYAKYLEGFSNRETLLEAQKLFEDSRILAEDFYTHPYSGLAKTALRLGDKEECLKILKVCGEIFSDEYHTHNFDEIIDDTDFEEVKDELLQIIAKMNSLE
jgi:tetratricopeptide (TPR) repeat protein